MYTKYLKLPLALLIGFTVFSAHAQMPVFKKKPPQTTEAVDATPDTGAAVGEAAATENEEPTPAPEAVEGTAYQNARSMYLDALDALYKADKARFLTHLDLSQIPAEIASEYKSNLGRALLENKQALFDPKGGVAKIEIVELQLNTNENEAVAHFKTTFANGETDEGTLGAILLNKQWKIMLNPVAEATEE